MFTPGARRSTPGRSSRSRSWSWTMTVESGLSTHLDTQVPLSQTCLQTCSALAACESTNHTAAVTTPIRILLIALPLDRPLLVNRVPDIWFRSFQPGAPNLALRRLDKEDRRDGMAR